MKSSTFMCLLIFSSVVDGKNIVMIIADDLDLVLDGMTPLEKTTKLIGNQGGTFANCFVASPICCPNRASILTGRYQHNHFTVNNSLSGGCSSQSWQNDLEKQTFATVLKDQLGYNTFYAGKYLNQYGTKGAGGPSHRPPGWDHWAGLVGNSQYYNYSLSINGTRMRYGDNRDDYLTDLIASLAVKFIKGPRLYTAPFLMVLAPPAPHAPFTPAPRHNDRYRHTKAKRTQNFNTSFQRDKHWLVRMGPSPLPNSTIGELDFVYRRRWETLLAVDELVSTVYNTLKESNLLNDTYIIFTSDNGYHIGQFSMPIDKRQPYETDIRVPLLIRGPGIVPSKISTPVSSVDLFATILEMAGTEEPSDGVSALANIPVDRTVLIEYHGEHSGKSSHTGCPSDNDLNLSQCRQDMACKCQDSSNNTYSCVRRFSETHNNIFCIFKDSEQFIEAYDLNADPNQMKNIGYAMNHDRRHKFRKRLKEMVKCKGANCLRMASLQHF